MANSKQALNYQRPSSIRDYKSWTPLGYVAVVVLALILLLALSHGPAFDPSFATETVMP